MFFKLLHTSCAFLPSNFFLWLASLILILNSLQLLHIRFRLLPCRLSPSGRDMFLAHRWHVVCLQRGKVFWKGVHTEVDVASDSNWYLLYESTDLSGRENILGEINHAEHDFKTHLLTEFYAAHPLSADKVQKQPELSLWCVISFRRWASHIWEKLYQHIRPGLRLSY